MRELLRHLPRILPALRGSLGIQMAATDHTAIKQRFTLAARDRTMRAAARHGLATL
jgi:hypothetical protein